MYTGFLPAANRLNLTSHEDLAFSLTWSPPFSLQITNADLLITYCVDVMASERRLVSQCGIRETEFFFQLVCYQPTLTVNVLAVNPVGNGTTATVTSVMQQQGISR